MVPFACSIAICFDTHMHHTCVFSIDYCMLFMCNLTQYLYQNNMSMHENNNMSKFSKCELCHKYKQQPQDIAQHKHYVLKSFVQHISACINGLNIYEQFQHGNTKNEDHMSVLNTWLLHCPWFEQFGCLYFMYCVCSGFTDGESQEDELYTDMPLFVCYTACNMIRMCIHCSHATHELLVKFLKWLY